jgi:hypothetical protein
MSVNRTLIIHTKTDSIRARMEVREAARLMGLDTRDQALISLATSSLTDALGWGTGQGAGTITIESLNGDKKKGLRVVCTFDNPNNNERVTGLIKGVRWMVDALDVRDPVGSLVEVALIKWAA